MFVWINSVCAIRQEGHFKDPLQKTVIKLQKYVWDGDAYSLAPEGLWGPHFIK